MGNLFSRPSATALFVVDGLSSSKLDFICKNQESSHLFFLQKHLWSLCPRCHTKLIKCVIMISFPLPLSLNSLTTSE